MNLNQHNSRILVIYLYLNVILSLFLFIFDTGQISNIRYLMYLLIFVYSLFINKFSFNKKYLLFLSVTLFLMLLNLLLVSYKGFIVTEIFSITMISLVPLYVISNNKVDFDYLLSFWNTTARFFTFLIPIFLLFYFKKIIGYWQIGDYTNINIMIFMYFYFIKKENKNVSLSFLLINLMVGLFFGSRSSIGGVIVTSTIVIIVFAKNKGIKYFLKIILGGIFLLTTLFNLTEILESIQKLLSKFNLNSRNIELFILQIKGGSTDTILSGRENIYDIVITYIKKRNGMPGGLSTTRQLTHGVFYHAHNVILDLLSIFGVLGTIIFFVWYFFKFSKLLKNKDELFSKFAFCFMLSISFWIASLTNAYFLNDTFFMCSISILIFTKNKDLKSSLNNNWN